MKKTSGGIKSHNDRYHYFQKMIKTPHGEKETYEEGSYDGTDTSPVDEDREVTKKEHRWRSPKRIVLEKAKSYWYLVFLVPLSIWFLNYFISTSNSIATLKERTKDIQFMKDKIITIDKNVEILKVKNEKDGEILDLKIQELQKKINKLEKK
jgi:hypothetical protein